MSIKEKLIENYPLVEKIENDYEFYKITPRKYVVFLDRIISNNDTEELLDKLVTPIKAKCSTVSTLIVVANTNEEFKQEDLVFFNGVDTFVVYYLINNKNGDIFFNDQRMYFFGAGWRKIVRKFNEILK